MARAPFGPVYCETANVIPGFFPAEPINTISNGVIVFFGLAAAYLVWKHRHRGYDLYALSALLVVNGIGSALWHGLRAPWALVFDVAPGLVFLFAFLFSWARRLWSPLWAGLFLSAFFVLGLLSREIWNVAQPWVALAPVVVAASIVLLSQTYGRSAVIAAEGGVALASALLALFFRAIDLAACSYLPFGTHFLWHIFLSAAGFIGIRALIRFPAKPRDPAAACVAESEA